MRPSLTIWHRTRETVQKAAENRWVDKEGIFVYLALVITTIAPNVVPLVGENNIIPGIVVSILMTFIVATLTIFLGVNVLWVIGRLLNGRATKKSIATVFVLGFLPQLLMLPFFLKALVTGQTGDVPGIVSIIAAVLTFRILVIGLSHVQRYSYGFAVVNLFLAHLLVSLALTMITSLF